MLTPGCTQGNNHSEILSINYPKVNGHATRGTIEVLVELLPKSISQPRTEPADMPPDSSAFGFGTEHIAGLGDQGHGHKLRNYKTGGVDWHPAGIEASVSFSIVKENCSGSKLPFLKGKPETTGDWKLNSAGWRRRFGKGLDYRGHGEEFEIK